MHATPRPRLRSVWLLALPAAVAALGVTVWLLRLQDSTACALPLPPARAVTLPAARLGMVAAPSVRFGHAVYYSSTGEVACSFRSLPADGLYASVSSAEYDRAGACGTYLDIAGPRDHVLVEVVDRCVWCEPGRLDLGRAAFARIADLSAGVVPVRYTTVRDPAPAGRLGFQVSGGSSAGWFGLLVSGNGDPLSSVEVRPSGGDWRRLTRGLDNYWTGSGVGSRPFAARVTDVYGHQAEVSGLTLSPGRGHETDTRLYGPSPVTAQPPATAQSPTGVMNSPAPRPLGGGDQGSPSTGGNTTTGCRGAGDHTSALTGASGGGGPWL